jgi:hypothetical protein
MILRPLCPADQKTVARLHAGSGFDFQFPLLESPLVESGCLVLDASGIPLAASVAKRSPEIVLAMRKDAHATVKLQALVQIHNFMRIEMLERGYTEANCFLPPSIEKSYGRHLCRIFGWQRSWQGYTLKAG